MGDHQTRTGILAWNPCILSYESRDRNIIQHDLRISNDFVSKFVGHKFEVCGLKWSHDDRELASGGNDNQLLIWNQHSQQPVLRLTEHTTAVKAIAWSPHQNGILASGGGTADRCIRFWNTSNGNIDTGSQVHNKMEMDHVLGIDGVHLIGIKNHTLAGHLLPRISGDRNGDKGYGDTTRKLAYVDEAMPISHKSRPQRGVKATYR